MTRSTSICFSKEGLVNPRAINYIISRKVDTVVLFGDGSEESFNHIRDFDISVLGDEIKKIGIGRTPLYEMRVVNVDGTISYPNYVFNDEVQMKWICSRICSHYINISISDIRSQSGTQVQLDNSQVAIVCYQANRLWNRLRVAEDRLGFPAVAIDRMTRSTYSLTPETIDIVLLRREVGLDSLSYNSATDLLSLEVGGDIFEVKMDVLQSFYGEFILPLFNRLHGRSLRIRASIMGTTGHYSEPVDMSYGELGRIVEELKIYARSRTITKNEPIAPVDLLHFSKKVKIDDESCLWMADGQTIADFADQAHDFVVRPDIGNDSVDEDYPGGEPIFAAA